MMEQPAFDRAFEALTGHLPLSWQRRLYQEHFAKGVDALPQVIGIPTGLGKTAVMAIWLIARANYPDRVPTRLVYVVDRRTVVDQATDLAVRLRDNCQQALGIEPPAISTLRGQLADNREWSRNPSRPAIIIGTVDLIGSALLFSGYRSSYKRRPLEAGLLGQDSLLVLDEAHLSRPFEKLIRAIDSEGPFQKDRDGRLQGNPMRVIRMSATSGSAESKPSFGLQIDADGRLTGEDAKDGITVQRWEAKKQLTVMPIREKKELVGKLADAAIELAHRSNLMGKRIVVFVQRPDDAAKIADAIRKHGGTKTKPGPFIESAEVLTGTMRGLERDELVQKPVLKRFLNGDESPGDIDEPVFLISTSAGEVGFDLNADHLVGDAAPLDSWIQRLGRVNRRGKGDARVILLKEASPADKTDFAKACIATSELFTNGMNVSPKAVAAFRGSLTPARIEQTSSPRPTMVELTDILLDGWSMTSILERMPGRPPVGPWLRGIADELPQTTLAWRAELDEPGFGDLDHDDIEEWFDTHRILTHETLSVKTSDTATWFKQRWSALPEAQKHDVEKRPVIVDRAGREIVPLGEIISRLSRKANDADAFLRGAEVIVPVSFGGIRRYVGLLDSTEPKLGRGDGERASDEQESILKDRQNEIDVADVRGRYRENIVKPEDGEAEIAPLIAGAAKPPKHARHSLELVSDDEKTVRIVSYVPRHEKPETGQEPQTLKEHVCAVRKAVDDILSRMALSEAITQAARLAADWHDHGKNRKRWQRLLIFPRDFIKPDEPMGKSGGAMRRDPRGYRHEFGSLHEFTTAHGEGKLLDGAGNPINEDIFDLAMHLIAAHHGRGRPHYPKGGFDPDDEERSEETHTSAIRRFARLQRKYGWWYLAWLENLLRCADAMASADHDAEGGAEQ